MESEFKKRLANSHIASYYFYKLEIVSVIIYDLLKYKARSSYQDSPCNLHSWLISTSDQLGTYNGSTLFQTLSRFRNTATWDTNFFIELIRNEGWLTKTKEKLSELKLVNINERNESMINQARTNDNYPNVFGPDRDISFGHYTCIFQVLRAAALLGIKYPFTFYRAPKTACAFSNIEIIVKNDCVRYIDLQNDLLSWQDLTNYYKRGGSENCRRYWNDKLFDHFGIPHENRLDSSYSFVQGNRGLVKRASRAILSQDFREEVNMYESGNVERFVRMCKTDNRPIISLTPRDSIYSGTGQPWRDTDIDKYNLTLRWLINNGYAVARVNPDGKPILFESDYLLDNTKVKACTSDQLKLIHVSQCCIGSSTGSTEYASQLFLKPTLYIDSSVLYNTGTLNMTAHSSKDLYVVNSEQLKRHSKDSINQFLFDSVWDLATCATFGLSLVSKEPDDILMSIQYWIKSNLMHTIFTAKNIYPETTSLQIMLGCEPIKAPMRLDPSTYLMVKNIIETYLGDKKNH